MLSQEQVFPPGGGEKGGGGCSPHIPHCVAGLHVFAARMPACCRLMKFTFCGVLPDLDAVGRIV